MTWFMSCSTRELFLWFSFVYWEAHQSASFLLGKDRIIALPYHWLAEVKMTLSTEEFWSLSCSSLISWFWSPKIRKCFSLRSVYFTPMSRILVRKTQCSLVKHPFMFQEKWFQYILKPLFLVYLPVAFLTYLIWFFYNTY